MIFKNCDGVLAADPDADRGRPGAARRWSTATIATRCRPRSSSSRSRQALESWMRAVFACNAYVDEQAPWALRKTDPERMRTVLVTLYVCIARAGGRGRPGHARLDRPGCSTQMGMPRTTARLSTAFATTLVLAAGRQRIPLWRSRSACSRGSNCPRKRRLMLIDRHCHLELRGPGRGPGRRCSTRARAAGVGGFLNISTRRSEWDAGRRHRRARARRLGQRRHPSARGRRSTPTWARRRCWRRPRTRRVDRASARAGSTTTTTIPTARCSAPCSARTSRVARETGLPLIVHTRDAEDDTAAILAEEMEQGRLPGADPLLHRLGRVRAHGARPRPDDLAVGHRHLQERQRLQEFAARIARGPAAGRNRQPVPRAGAAPRPDLRAGLRARHRARSSPSLRGVEARGTGGNHDRATSSSLFAQGRAREADHARLGHLDRGAADRRRLGRMRSGRAEEPAHAGFDHRRERRRRAAAGRYLARSCASSCSPTASTGSTRCSGPTTTPIIATASMTCGRCASAARAAPGLRRRRDRAAAARSASAMSSPAQLRLSDDRRARHARAVRICAGFAVGWCQMPHGPTRAPASASKRTANQSVMRRTSARSRSEMVDAVRRCRHPGGRLPAPRAASDACAPGDGARARPSAAGARHDGADASRQEHGLRDACPPKCRRNVLVGYDGLELAA